MDDVRAVVTPAFNVDNIIKQSNRLVEAKYYLTQMEQRFILLFIAHLPQDAADLCDVTLNLADVMKGMGYNDSGEHYQQLYEILDNIMLKVLTIRSKINNATWYKTHWVQSIFYDADNRTITVGFDARLKDDLLQLHKAYVSTNARLLINFKGKYTARIYLLIKQYLSAGERILTLDFLVNTFQLPKSYSLRSSKLQDLLVYAYEQIMDRSDITCKWEQVRKGRKIIGFRIYNIREKITIKERQAPPVAAPCVPNMTESETEVYKRLTNSKWKITQKSAIRLLAKFGEKRILRNICYCDKTKQNKYNLAGYLIRAIYDDYAADEERRRQDDEHERQKMLERSASIGRPIVGGGEGQYYELRVTEKTEQEKAEEERYKNELRPLEVELIKKNGENVFVSLKRKMKKLGLSVADVMGGKYSGGVA